MSCVYGLTELTVEDVAYWGCCFGVESAACCAVGYGKTPVVALLTVVVDVDAGAVLNTRGADVNGGGRGVPLRSPLMLRRKGGSSSADLSFLPLSFEVGSSFEPDAAACAAAWALLSCSSRAWAYFSSTDQKKPLPLSPPHRSIFKNARPEDRLCRTELIQAPSA